MTSYVSAANEDFSPMSLGNPGKKRPTGERNKKQYKYKDAEALRVVLHEKNRQIQLLRAQLKLSDEYGRNLRDLLEDLVKLLAIIEQ